MNLHVTNFNVREQQDRLEKMLIKEVLKKTNGNKLKAAGMLSITRQRLYERISRYEIKT